MHIKGGLMVEWMVIEIAANGEHRGHGALWFRVTPRTGEVMTMNNQDGIGEAFEVVQVVHAVPPTDTGGDLIIRSLGAETDWRRSL